METFLLIDINIKVMLKALFLALSKVNISFLAWQLTWKSYIVAKALPTTKQIELIDKKEFAKAVLDENSETFVIYVIILSLTPTLISSNQKA